MFSLPPRDELWIRPAHFSPRLTRWRSVGSSGERYFARNTSDNQTSDSSRAGVGDCRPPSKHSVFCRLPDGTSCAAVAASAINPAVSTPGRDMGQGHRAPPHLSAVEMVCVGTSYQKRYVTLENARKRYICSQGLREHKKSPGCPPAKACTYTGAATCVPLCH